MSDVASSPDDGAGSARPARSPAAGRWRRAARHWRFAAPFFLMPAVLGGIAAALLPADREAETRLLIRGADGGAGTETALAASEPVRRAALTRVGAARVYPDRADDLDRAVAALGRDLTVELLPHSNVVRITFVHPDPRTAVAVVDAVAGAYEEARQRPSAVTPGPPAPTDNQAARLATIDRDIADLRSQVSAAADPRRDALAQAQQARQDRLARVQQQRADLVRARATDGASADAPAAAPPPKPAQAPVWASEQLRQRLADAQADRARLISIFGPQSSRILDRQIAILQQQLAPPPAPAAPPPARPRAQGSTLEEMAADLSRLDREVSDLTRDIAADDAEQRRLADAAAAPATHLDALLRERASLIASMAASPLTPSPIPAATADADRSGVTVLDQGRISDSGLDWRAVTLAAGILVGLILAPAAALARASRRPTVFAAADLEGLGVRCLGTVTVAGRAGSEPTLTGVASVARALSEAIAACRPPPRMLALRAIAPVDSELAGALVRDLAAALAGQSDTPLLLVDNVRATQAAHFAERGLMAEPVAEAFTLEAEPAEARPQVGAAVTGNRALVLRGRRIAGPPLVLAQTGDAEPVLAAVRRSPGSSIARDMSRRFHLVVIDESDAPTATSASTRVDAAVTLIVAAASTPRETVRLARQTCVQANETLLGAVLLDRA